MADLKLPFKAVVMDMDGTLLNEHNQISDKTRNYLIDLEKQGVKLVLASGRSYTRLLGYADQLEMPSHGGYLIEIDGVALYDLANQERTKFKMMSPEEIHDLFAYLITQNAESQAMFDDGLFDFFTPEIFEIKKQIRKEQNLPDDFPWTAGPWNWLTDFRDGYGDMHYIQTAEEITRPINKLQIMQEEKPLAELYERLQERFSNSFAIYRTTPRQLEVLPFGYSKGMGLRKLMEKEGWDKDEVLVFGDGENDLSMFEEVTHSFAMGNAAPFVQQKASAVTATNREDGIVQAIETLRKRQDSIFRQKATPEVE